LRQRCRIAPQNDQRSRQPSPIDEPTEAQVTFRRAEFAAIEIAATERHHRQAAGLVVAERGNLASRRRLASEVRRTQYVLGFRPSEAARLLAEPVSVSHALGDTCDPLAAAGCSVLCTRPYHWSKIALILGPYVHFTAAEVGRFAIKRRPSGWRSGPLGSDRQADDGGTPR
jgi:hypothetical protein